ncbi:DNA-binding protein smubp-2 [Dorcoceras hygrometricum]|uniref:DNA-binding protein smubp-2 n=1 Tax=Dorcoceras hygrometricum TaxID=472368 RepID=A0A2Z7A6R7_9LAMI|nr:DNA-binding protein smubp-2 [Dorcoceras hygrometricum]
MLLGNRGGSGSRLPARQRKNKICRETINTIKTINRSMTFIGRLDHYLAPGARPRAAPRNQRPAMAHSPDQQQLAPVNHRAILRDAAAREATFHAQQFARRIAIFQPPCEASAHGCRARIIVLIRSENLGSDTTVGELRRIRIAPPVSRGNRHFTVDCGRLRQSGPRPETRLLRQPALEGLTRSAWTDSPRQVGRNNFAAKRGGGGGGGGGDGL